MSPAGVSVTITAWRTSLPSGADCALGLGGGEPGPAAGDAGGDEVAGAADDEADEPRDVGAAEDADHRPDVEGLVDEGDLGAERDHVGNERGPAPAAVDAPRGEERRHVVAALLHEVEVDEVDHAPRDEEEQRTLMKFSNEV